MLIEEQFSALVSRARARRRRGPGDDARRRSVVGADRAAGTAEGCGVDGDVSVTHPRGRACRPTLLALSQSNARGSTARSTRSPRALAAQMRGTTWHPGCPVPLDGLSLLHFNYWGFGGQPGPRPHGRERHRRRGRPVGLPPALRRALPDQARSRSLDPVPPQGVRAASADRQQPERDRFLQLPAGGHRHRSRRRLLAARLWVGDRSQPPAEPVRHDRRVRPQTAPPSPTRSAAASWRAWSTRATSWSVRSPRSAGSGAGTGAATTTSCTSLRLERSRSDGIFWLQTRPTLETSVPRFVAAPIAAEDLGVVVSRRCSPSQRAGEAKVS